MSKLAPAVQTAVTTPAQALVAIGTLLASQGKIFEGVGCILVGAGITWLKLRVKDTK